MLSHAHINLKSVWSAADTVCIGDGASAGVCVGSLGGSATGGTGTSRVLNTVSFLDTQKIPLLTHPADFASHTCLASLNEAGADDGTARAGGIGVEFASGGGGASAGVEGV
jgi:hypothetical protein